MGFGEDRNLTKFPTNEPLQRFFPPQYNPVEHMAPNPEFNRFFKSSDHFEPQTNMSKIPHASNMVMNQNANCSENDSDTSSIRSSASAYWPPELKFMSGGDESDVVNRRMQTPAMKLRKKTPLSNRIVRLQ